MATANDVTKLPPEFLRAGRWDDVFFVDLPTAIERAQIAAVMARKFGRAAAVDSAAVAAASAGYTGAEMEASYAEALYTAFADGERDVTTADVLAALAARVPLSKTAPEKLDALRKWARGRARLAGLPESGAAATGRAIE